MNEQQVNETNYSFLLGNYILIVRPYMEDITTTIIIVVIVLLLIVIMILIGHL